MTPPDFEYYLLMDIEATCLKDMRINPQEAIEISVTLMEVK